MGRRSSVASKKTLNANNLEALGAARLAQLLLEITKGDATAKRRLRLELAGRQGFGEAAKEIRKGGIKNLPIIALTAAATTEDQKKCLSAGMNDFITKPVNQTILKEAILRWGKEQL